MSGVSDWDEIIIPASVASASEVAALVADEVGEARKGAQIRGTEVVFWVARERRDQALRETREAVARLAAGGFDVDPAGVRTQPAVPEDEWREAWKRHFHVTRLTRQIVVVPSWESFQPEGDDIAIALDPGQAFGTGAHASTRLVLGELQELCDAGVEVARVLDVGCGSGILAIAATRLWPACSGVAVDVDPLAVSAAADNCAHNGVADRIEVGDTPAAEVVGEFDLVVANIQAAILRAMADALRARVAPGGHLILSGLLTHQAQDLGHDLAAGGALELVRVRPSDDDGDWSSALLRRPRP
ncbi:50S ribosomal protein L11 methyltransferase [Haliangium sp.]|uniref:50S ribosomal protein L11 methyltransferase n=1 Tax=Haliangium sp. TaxID=2663208 RepID=UPI003D12401C